MIKAQKEGDKDFSKAGEHLTEAVDGLRKAGTLHHLPRGLLAHAEYWRVVGVVFEFALICISVIRGHLILDAI